MIKTIRISHDLSAGEKNAITQKRAAFIDSCALHHIRAPEGDIPHFAVLGSGGGMRAMLGLLGTLHQLCDEKLMDFFIYLSGVSGSTWCMSSLYDYGHDWPKNMADIESKICAQLLRPQPLIAKDGLNLAEDAALGEQYSLTDFWAYLIISHSLHKVDEVHLSSQQCDTQCSAPYPIYAAIDKKKFDEPDGLNNSDTWVEFTPREAGYPARGAFVDIAQLGSQFQKGDVVKEEPEKILAYLNGMWGSALGDWQCIKRTITDYLWHLIFGKNKIPEPSTVDFIGINLKHVYDLIMNINMNMECDSERKYCLNTLKQYFEEHGKTESETYKTALEMYETWDTSSTKTKENQFEQLFMNFVSDVKGSSQMKMEIQLNSKLWTLIKRTTICIFYWQWGTCHNFLYNCGYSEIPKEHTVDKFLSLIDAGLAINVAYPLMLRKQREVRLLLSFDFSSGDPFLTLITTKEYCSKNKIPFPEIDVENLKKEKDNPSDCYVFKGSDTAPTVMHFVLFNNVNCNGEIKQWQERYSTFKRSYTKDDIDQLLEKAKQNVTNNVKKIIKTIETSIAKS